MIWSIFKTCFRYMYWLYRHLKPGSFRTVYADTDSICLALSQTTNNGMDNLEKFYRGLFDNIVKEDMRESWEASWRSWIVTTREPEDEKCPGKMKREYLSIIMLHESCHIIWTI